MTANHSNQTSQINLPEAGQQLKTALDQIEHMALEYPGAPGALQQKVTSAKALVDKLIQQVQAQTDRLNQQAQAQPASSQSQGQSQSSER